MVNTRDNTLTLDDFAKLPSGLVWGAINEKYNAGTNPFRSAGVLVNSPLISTSLTSGTGIRTEVEAWNDIEYVESNVGNTDPEDHATPLKMNTSLWSAVRRHGSMGVAGANLTQDFSAQDPLAVLTARVANYRNTDELTHLFAVLDGLIAGDATAKKFTYTMDGAFDITQVLKALQAAKGDNAGVVKSIGMNSVNYLALQLAGLVETTRSDANTEIKSVAKLEIVVDDRFKSNIVGMGPGLFHVGSAPQARKSVELSSVGSAGRGTGVETAWFRWKSIVHPMGFNFTGTFASEGGPEFDELKVANAYTLATDVKKLPLVVIKPGA